MRHHPRDIAKALAKEIRKAGKVKILKVTGSDIRQGGRFAGVPLSLPNSSRWDGEAYTVLEVTSKVGEPYNVAITVLWAGVGAAGGGEYSGNVHADAPRGVIPLQRVYQQRGEGDGEVLDRFIKLAGSDMRDMLGVSTYARGGKARKRGRGGLSSPLRAQARTQTERKRKREHGAGLIAAATALKQAMKG